MSARDELIRRLANDDYSHDTFAESERAAAEALDAYRDEVAHELAEKIRNEVYKFLAQRYGFGGDPKSPWVQGQMDAAELIDPDKQ